MQGALGRCAPGMALGVAAVIELRVALTQMGPALLPAPRYVFPAPGDRAIAFSVSVVTIRPL